MRTLFVLALTLCANVSLADDYNPAPSRETLALAKQLKATADGLVGRMNQLAARLEKTRAKLATAGVKFGADWNTPERDHWPTPEDIASVDEDWKALTADAEKLKNEYDAYHARLLKLGVYSSTSEGPFPRDVDDARTSCVRYFDSMHEASGACAQWNQVKSALWPSNAAAENTPSLVQNAYASYRTNFRREWGEARNKEVAANAQDAIATTALTGNALQRAIVIPRKFKTNDGGHTMIDGRALFAAAHPSHFVFLRKDLAEAAEGSGYRWLARKLQKGEAVLPVRGNFASPGSIEIVSVDGLIGVVRTDDVALSPLPGKSVAPLRPDDLVVTDDKGAVLAGPLWLRPDSTGFNLDESTPWLDLLDPPEPRSQKFIDAKNKILACYKKQWDRLDPDGGLHYGDQVVTYGRGGVEKVEDARTNFDRKVCSACGCKAFNAMKSKLVKTAIAPGQKAAFEAYKPVLDHLKKTDFKAAGKGAPKGDDSWVPHAI